MASYFPGIDPELRPHAAREALHGLNKLLAQLPPRAELNAADILGITTLIEMAGPLAPPNDNDT